MTYYLCAILIQTIMFYIAMELWKLSGIKFQREIPVCLKEDFLGIPSRTLKHVSSSFVYASKVGICCSHPITYEQNYLVIKYNMPSFYCCFRCHNSSCSFGNCRQNPFVISNLNAQIYKSVFNGFTSCKRNWYIVIDNFSDIVC